MMVRRCLFLAASPPSSPSVLFTWLAAGQVNEGVSHALYCSLVESQCGLAGVNSGSVLQHVQKLFCGLWSRERMNGGGLVKLH